MFSDFIVQEYLEDVNDLAAITAKQKKKPIVVFGCGGAGREATELLAKHGLQVEAYCEGEKYWREGKSFLERPVLLVNDVPGEYSEATLIISATGPEILDSISMFKKIEGYTVLGYVGRNQLYTMNSEWIVQHKRELGNTFDLLEDEESRLVFLSYLGARANCIRRGDTVPLINLWKSRQYFNELYPVELFKEHILIDCGAWIGDTAEAFIRFIGENKPHALVRAFEMEDDNYKALLNVAERFKGQIIPYRCGVGDRKETLYFEKNSDASVIVDYETDNKVEILPVDDILNGEERKASFVKMDLEGYERNALLGMRNLVKTNLPMLAVCVYHKIDDLIVMPELIRKMEKESPLYPEKRYRYYLRHHSHNASELVFYAVPVDA